MEKNDKRIVCGPFKEVYNFLDKDTIMQSDELMLARAKEMIEAYKEKKKELPELMLKPIDPANICIYGRKGNSFDIYLGGREAFNKIVAENLEDICAALDERGKLYKTQETDVNELVERKWLIKIPYDNLGSLANCSDKIAYFDVATDEYEEFRLNEQQRTFAEFAYGTGRSFNMTLSAMKWFLGIGSTRIHVYNKDLLKDNLKDGELKSCNCYLNSLVMNFSFGATSYLNNRDHPSSMILMGMPKE